MSFEERERQRQSEYFSANFPGKNGYEGLPFLLDPTDRALNRFPPMRDAADRYFEKYGIGWHRYANHALSSQVCCLNFLMPLRNNPEMLSRLVGDALGIASPEMIAVEEGPDGIPWFVGFEWIGRSDYLHEAGPQGKRTRGANSTSADAVVRFHHNGHPETLLIEWKYTESYGGPINPEGNATRISRYQDIAFTPDGPIRNDLELKLEDFFYEPLYQLLRQQMLAFQMQKPRGDRGAGEDGTKRVRVLHISPSENTPLRKVTSPSLNHRFGTNVFDVFRSVLVTPEDFISQTTEMLFGRLLSDDASPADWASYIRNRYLFCTRPT